MNLLHHFYSTIMVFCFNTDYVFVKSVNFVRALDALAAAGCEVESTFV